MISVDKIHQILEMAAMGFTVADIAERIKIGHFVVRAVLKLHNVATKG